MTDLERIRRAVESLSDAEREELAHELLRAIHAQGGRELSRNETIEALERPVLLFRPPKKKRGPSSPKSVYELAYPRRRGLWFRLAQLPNLRNGAGASLLRQVDRFARAEVERRPLAPARTLARRVSQEMALRGQGRDIDTTRIALQALGYLERRNPPK